MSKLLSSVLERVSENNNEYRIELQNLNKIIDEKTSALVGDVVTLSNYTIDFSNAVTYAKENLVNPISRIVESYVIKDLRSVETVNEQFVDKINDKLENANITTTLEKNKFIDSLNSLLNDKYLEIVRIKRVDFTGVDGTNQDLEGCVNNFTNYLSQKIKLDSANLMKTLNIYKSDLYNEINNTLAKISKLYLNNFVSEVSMSLNGIIDLNAPLLEEDNNNLEVNDVKIPFVPEIPEIPSISDIPSVPDIPEIPTEQFAGNTEVSEYSPEEEKTKSFEEPSVDSYNTNEIPTISETQPSLLVQNNDEALIENDVFEPMEITPVAPIEVHEDNKETPIKQYDVEEILKIAKSPVANIASEEKTENDYLSIKPIEHISNNDTKDLEFNEKEIVEEMIRRLSLRLDKINERQAKIDDDEKKIAEDEIFVNDLIESSNNKKIELDEFEKSLDEKEFEITEKQKELDKKLNDILPFANAIMKNEEVAN